MSRLDYFTVSIVGLCILAIIFLLYKVVGNVSSDATTTQTEISVDGDVATDEATSTLDGAMDNDDTDLDDEDTIIDDEDAIIDEEVTMDGYDDTDNDGFTTTTIDDGDGDFVEEAIERAEAVTDAVVEGSIPQQVHNSDGSPGNYMVFAGTFSVRQNADNLARKLRQNGFDNAKVGIFNGGKYAVVMVDRFKYFDDAKALGTNLQVDGYDFTIHRKRGAY